MMAINTNHSFGKRTISNGKVDHKNVYKQSSGKHMHLKRFTVGDFFIYGITSLICIIFILPFVYVISISLTDPEVYVPFRLYLFPKKLSLETYEYILSNSAFITSLKNTLIVTIVGTVLCIFTTYTFAFVLTRRGMPFHKVFMGMVVFTLMCNLRRVTATDALTSGRLAEQNGRPPDTPNSVLQLDHHDIMLGDPLEDCVSRYCIVHDHGLPFVWFPLGTDDSAP